MFSRHEIMCSLSKSFLLKMFSANTETQSRRFQILSVEERFRDGLVYPVGLTVERKPRKLRFQISAG